MAKVAIVMGSDSDMPVMAQAADVLEKLGVDFEITVISAHREPDIFFEYAKTAEARGVKVMIAGAGKAAHLPGMCAALFPMPVIGIPMKTSDLAVWTLSIPSYRCRAAYRLPRLRLMEERTREFSRRRSLLRLMKRCSAN